MIIRIFIIQSSIMPKITGDTQHQSQRRQEPVKPGLDDWQEFLSEFGDQGYQKAIKIDTSDISYLKNTKAGKDWFGTFLDEKGGRKHLEKNEFGYLPKGTKIYHGTFYPIETLEKGKHMYFSLFPLISLWIITEDYHRQVKEIRQMFNQIEIDYEQLLPNNGYLYEFELQKDLPLLFTDEFHTDQEHGSICHQSIPCLQTQWIWIFGPENWTSEDFYDSYCIEDPNGSELIIPYDFIMKYLKFMGAMKVDLKSLFSVDCDWEKYENYDPFEAILGPISVKNPLK